MQRKPTRVPTDTTRTAADGGLSEQRAQRLFRETTRAPLAAPVTLQFDTVSHPERGYTTNVSAGGMFVRSRDPRPVGTRLRFELRLKGFSKPAVGFAEVVWHRGRPKRMSDFTGMGLEFRYVDPQSQFRVEAAVCAAIEDLKLEEEPEASLTGAGLRARPPFSGA